MNIFKPPMPIPLHGTTSVFLAGSIEMDKAVKWQDRVINLFNGYDVNIFNPRRDNWDATLTQSINEPVFAEQVNWELGALAAADVIIMYFDPATKSPISLLELGLYASSGKLLVICPEGFWRKGNVDIVCQRYNIPQFDTLLDAVVDIMKTENIRRTNGN